MIAMSIIYGHHFWFSFNAISIFLSQIEGTRYALKLKALTKSTSVLTLSTKRLVKHTKKRKENKETKINIFKFETLFGAKGKLLLFIQP